MLTVLHTFGMIWLTVYILIVADGPYPTDHVESCIDMDHRSCLRVHGAHLVPGMYTHNMTTAVCRLLAEINIEHTFRFCKLASWRLKQQCGPQE